MEQLDIFNFYQTASKEMFKILIFFFKKNVSESNAKFTDFVVFLLLIFQ